MSETLQIVDGPDQDRLFAALQAPQGENVVTFWRRSGPVALCVNKIERESGDGVSFIVHGYEQGVNAPLQIYWNCLRLRGHVL